MALNKNSRSGRPQSSSAPGTYFGFDPTSTCRMHPKRFNHIESTRRSSHRLWVQMGSGNAVLADRWTRPEPVIGCYLALSLINDLFCSPIRLFVISSLVNGRVSACFLIYAHQGVQLTGKDKVSVPQRIRSNCFFSILIVLVWVCSQVPAFLYLLSIVPISNELQSGSAPEPTLHYGFSVHQTPPAFQTSPFATAAREHIRAPRKPALALYGPWCRDPEHSLETIAHSTLYHRRRSVGQFRLGCGHKCSRQAKELEIKLVVWQQIEGDDQVPEGSVRYGLRYLVSDTHTFLR